MTSRPAPLASQELEERLRRNFGRVVFTTRWLLAPIYFGLLATLLVLAVKFVEKLVDLVRSFLHDTSAETIIDVLQLVDLALVANLVLLVMFSGWQNVIGRLLPERGSEFTGLRFSALKQSLIASVAAIAAIQILETFMHITPDSITVAMWQLAILLGVAITGVLLAAMDKLGGGGH
jgi:uncharacterized protein (TIGR00645 family)